MMLRNDRDLAERWGVVTELELIFAALRAQHGLLDATRVLAEVVQTANHAWLTAHLVTAIAALDSVRHE